MALILTLARPRAHDGRGTKTETGAWKNRLITVVYRLSNYKTYFLVKSTLLYIIPIHNIYDQIPTHLYPLDISLESIIAFNTTASNNKFAET